MRLERRLPDSAAPHTFRVYTVEPMGSRTWEEIRRMADDEQVAHDLAKLGLLLKS